MRERIPVSIFMLTYNQERYIRQALDSILMQKVNFEYEIVIGDDCSTDSTPDILKEYYRKWPDRIKLILRKKNVGVTKNLYDVLRKMRGDYVACLEGDDYWTDENKLQKQYDFLEANREYVACVHDYERRYDDGSVKIEHCLGAQKNNGESYKLKGNCWTLHDYEATRGIPSHANTLFFRNFMLEKNLDFSYFYKASGCIGDQTLFLTILSKGNIYCMPELMSVYRYVTKAGESNVLSTIKNKNYEYQHYIYQANQEKYLRENLSTIVDLSLRKKNVLASAVSSMVRKKKWEDVKAVFNIILASDSKREYICFALKASILKQYYLLTGQEDKRVEVTCWRRKKLKRQV